MLPFEDFKTLVMMDKYWGRRIKEESYENSNVWEDLYNCYKKHYNYLKNVLKERGIDINHVNCYNIIPTAIYCYFYEENPPADLYIIYGKTMGFVTYDGGKTWHLLEGSDEPEPLDIMLYEKLLGGDSSRKVTLYDTHGRDFVNRWRTEGIPEGVYFSSDRFVAEKYWHPGGDDVLVRVKLPEKYVIKTAEDEYKTIKTVPTGKQYQLAWS